MYILMVRLKVKQDHINDFIKASIADGTGSVLHEPGCRRFDIIQDETDPTLFAFNEVYNDEAAFEHHKTTPHFKQWDAAVKHMLDGAVEVSFCRPVFPLGNATWDAHRPGAVEDPAFASSLHVIHAPLPIQPDKVDAFIAAVTLDGLGSTQPGAWLPAVRCLPKYQQAQRVVPLRGLRQQDSVRVPHQDTAHRQVA